MRVGIETKQLHFEQEVDSQEWRVFRLPKEKTGVIGAVGDRLGSILPGLKGWRYVSYNSTKPTNAEELDIKSFIDQISRR